jgi:hypothetical protein
VAARWAFEHPSCRNPKDDVTAEQYQSSAATFDPTAWDAKAPSDDDHAAPSAPPRSIVT